MNVDQLHDIVAEIGECVGGNCEVFLGIGDCRANRSGKSVKMAAQACEQFAQLRSLERRLPLRLTLDLPGKNVERPHDAHVLFQIMRIVHNAPFISGIRRAGDDRLIGAIERAATREGIGAILRSCEAREATAQICAEGAQEGLHAGDECLACARSRDQANPPTPISAPTMA